MIEESLWISLQIICKNRNKFLGRQRTGIWITGDMAEIFSVVLRPVSIEERPYAVLDGIGRYVKIFRRIEVKHFAGKKRSASFR